ncbi:MAG: glycosyltransferase family 2 protein [Pseudomonadota bacterium]
MSLTVCIFSFNRGKYLKNCVESVQKCITDAEIIIFDDFSDDPDTQEYLKQAANSCKIISPKEIGTIKHGGLYHNMNTALELFHDRELICFLQDDTQVVRPVSSEELEEMKTLFDCQPTLGFLHPCFIRGIDLKKRPVIPLSGSAANIFFRQDCGQSAGIYYSDLVVFKPARLISAGWNFQQSEPANDAQARKHFNMMAYMWLPFAMWLPEVPAYRGKQKTLGLRLAENKKRVGFYPFRLLSDQEVVSIQQQEPLRLPIAEDYLECTPTSPPKPWTYNPLTGLKLFKNMNNLEIMLRRWFKV